MGGITMKKYILKLLKDDNYLCGTFFTKQQAVEEMNIFMASYNESVSIDEQITPFDFNLEEVDFNEINEAVTEFEKARLFLGIKPNMELIITKKSSEASALPFEETFQFLEDLNPRYLKALSALNKLFTIAEAWNKADDFVPDFSNVSQCKYYPWFVYDKDAAGFVYARTAYTATNTNANFGSRLCFKTANRARHFGKMFADLYNEVFLFNDDSNNKQR